jgi:hypothetical protein
MILRHQLTSSTRRYAPLAWLRKGIVCPGARMFGDFIAGGRAP